MDLLTDDSLKDMNELKTNLQQEDRDGCPETPVPASTPSIHTEENDPKRRVRQ